MSLSSVAVRRARSLLHWKVDPEIFPLVAVVAAAGGIGAYTLYSKKQNHGAEGAKAHDPLHPENLKAKEASRDYSGHILKPKEA